MIRPPMPLKSASAPRIATPDRDTHPSILPFRDADGPVRPECLRPLVAARRLSPSRAATPRTRTPARARVERRVVADQLGRQRRPALHRPPGHRRERRGARQRDGRGEVLVGQPHDPAVLVQARGRVARRRTAPGSRTSSGAAPAGGAPRRRRTARRAPRATWRTTACPASATPLRRPRRPCPRSAPGARSTTSRTPRRPSAGARAPTASTSIPACAERAPAGRRPRPPSSAARGPAASAAPIARSVSSGIVFDRGRGGEAGDVQRLRRRRRVLDRRCSRTAAAAGGRPSRSGAASAPTRRTRGSRRRSARRSRGRAGSGGRPGGGRR